MCFLLGVVSHDVQRVEDRLNSLKYFARRNRDGWGIGWYSNGTPVVFKRTKSALKDPVYDRVSSSVLSKMIIAHLRAKSRGNTREVNTHPFRIDSYLFAHNGTLDRKALERELKGRWKKLEGDTDSERLFHLFAQYIDRYGMVHGMRRALKRIDRIAESGAYVGFVNILLSDGRYMLAFSKAYRSRKRGLYYFVEDGIRRRITFATLPLTDGNWIKLENGELVIIDSTDMDLKSTVIG